MDILEAMERSGRKDDETAIKHAERCRAQLAEYQTLAAEVRDRGSSPELDQRLRDQLWRWFQDKIVVVEDYHATGEQIVRLLADLTTPGFRNRIMGMQNIKGTGLDFVYRWHAWETVKQACADALSEDPGRQHRGLQLLASFREYGVLSREAVQNMLRELRERPGTRGELAGGKLDLIDSRVNEQLALLDSKSEESGGGGSGGKWIARLEAFLDAGDAVRRRKQAERIYKELAAERISSDRAVSELKRLTSRQKGGWLAKDLRERKLLR